MCVSVSVSVCVTPALIAEVMSQAHLCCILLCV